MSKDILSLDNPIWSALNGPHARLASAEGGVKRYPRNMGPFAGIAQPYADADTDLVKLLAKDERVHLIGVLPQLSSKWRVEPERPLLQMVCERRLEVPGMEVPISTLSAPDLNDMLDLTALTYPEYFRPRTPEMGTYLGIRQNGRLAAMAGERMNLGSHHEISTVCTHPEFLGRGFAAGLIARLVNAALDRGVIPFLHVSPENSRAVSLYERLGFAERRRLLLLSVQRLT